VRIWEVDYDPMNKIWTWRLRLPNGWTANVTDDSQFGYPKKPTHYLAAAISRMRIIQAKAYRYSLREAKEEARELALSQETVPA
jgi:hypothetical protein